MHPATGKQKTAVGLLQPGPRLPVPVPPSGTKPASLARSPCSAVVKRQAIAAKQQKTSRTQPGVHCPPGGATTSGFRIGRKPLQHVAFMTLLTSRGRWKFCQAKSAGFINFLRRKEHISGYPAASLALGPVQIPVGAPNVIVMQIPEGTGGAVNGLRISFEFQKDAHGSLIQVQMKLRHPEPRAIFLVSEPHTQPERPQDLGPT